MCVGGGGGGGEGGRVLDNLPNAHLGQHAFRNVKYEKLKNNYDIMWLLL